MKSEDSQRDQMLMLLKSVIMETLGNLPVNVYLFGSWARGEEKRTSDIDVGILPNEELSTAKWVELLDRIEESLVPYNVDMVDLSRANPVILEKVKREGIVWKDCSKDSSLQTKH